jgi:DNA (cytosine-5)-methyltransferase 1
VARRHAPARLRPQILCLNSAHAGGETNPHAPQWRDRLYVVFTRKGMPAPNLDPRPIAWCPTCDADVLAVQSWKKLRGRKVGKYRQQYVYRCPNFACRHSVIEPYVLPAAAAIDWSDLGQRIGDRARPLAAATMRRIRAGLELFAEPAVVRACGGDSPGRTPQARVWPAATEPLCSRLTSNVDGVAVPAGALVPAGGTWNDDPTGLDRPMRTRTAREAEGVLTPPVVLNVNHRGDDGRPYPAGAGPLAPRTTKIGDGIATAEPFITMLRNNNVARGIDDPLDTIAAGGKHHGLTVPPGAFYVKHFTPRGENWSGMSKDVRTEPFGAITSADHHSLIIPYRRGNRPRTTAEPLHAVSTHESAGLLKPTVEVEDCHFRMLKPREHLRAQRFPDTYVVLGNKGEQTMQAGNAVSSNVAHWIGERIAAVLGGAA